MNGAAPRPTLKTLIDATPRPVVLPGVGSALEAKIATAVGFEGIYVSGYATAAWQLARPDIGLLGLGELAACVASVRGATHLPILVDADTGYGDVSSVVNTVRRLEQAGASGIQLEDQTWPKRCGHLDGNTVVPTDTMVRKIRAAVEHRCSKDLFVVARTDARSPLGLDEALRRCEIFADAGADAVFVDAPQSAAELERIGATVDVPLVANMSESGRTPILPEELLGAWGYDIILYPTGALRAAAAAIHGYFDHLHDRRDSTGHTGTVMTMDRFNTVVGMGEFRAIENGLM